ncbi:probable cyclin-dependent serine/threonine-protein kinase DDB_G0292550 [Gryllus bimaculatus]|nr:probable cyclin-dependent serine/threonine-protein kinase DDB_G0292550 [Gryllus bimaculatus]
MYYSPKISGNTEMMGQFFFRDTPPGSWPFLTAPHNSITVSSPPTHSHSSPPVLGLSVSPIVSITCAISAAGEAARVAARASAASRWQSRGHHYTPEEEPKSCCGVVVTQTVSIRWFIVMIAFVGICCAVVGTVLGAMKASGREHLTVSLLMIAMMYPEFQYRPPPPSYQASMQEYRLRLLLLDRHPGGSVPGPGQTTGGHMVSPPPTYRSHAGSTLSRAPLGLRRDQMQSDYSRPPSYRSRTSSTRPTLDPNGNMGCSTAEHSRDPSLSLSESGGGSAVVNVISVMGNGGSEAENLDNIKMLPDQEVPLRMMLNKGCHSSHMNVRSSVDEAKDANLVTIVQTGNDTSPVIVTVSGSTMATTTGSSTSASGVDTEMEILAHL